MTASNTVLFVCLLTNHMPLRKEAANFGVSFFLWCDTNQNYCLQQSDFKMAVRLLLSLNAV